MQTFFYLNSNDIIPLGTNGFIYCDAFGGIGCVQRACENYLSSTPMKQFGY